MVAPDAGFADIPTVTLRYSPWLLVVGALAFALPVSANHCPDIAAEAEVVAGMRDSNPTAGIERGEAALAELGDTHNCPAEEARLHGAVASNLIILGRNPEAVERFGRAIARGGDHLTALDRATLHRGKGLAHYDAGDFDLAVQHYVASLRASEEAGDVVEAAKTAGNIGILYNTLGQLDDSEAYLERALEGFTASDFKPGIAGTLINLGSLAAKRALDAKAIGDEPAERAFNEQLRDYNQQAMDLFAELGNRRGVAYAASNVGLAHDRLGEPAVALPFHERSLAVRREVGDVHGTINSLVSMAAALTALRRFDDAETHLQEARELLPEGNPTLHLSVAEPAVQVAEARGDYQEALRRQREVAQIRSEIAASDLRARVAEIQTRFDSEQLQRQVVELEHEQALVTERFRLQQQRTLAAAAISLLLLALIITLFMRYRLKVRSQLALEQAARTDELTGLSNRRDMRERIAYEIQRTRRNTRPFSVALIDIDNFKAVNDTFGHEAGDGVLNEVVSRIQSQHRRQDTLARWGGDELLLLLPETDEAGALELSNKIAASFSSAPIAHGGHEHAITLSIGVAQYWPGMDLDECLRCADAALYRSKEQGRNRVEAGRP